MNRLIVLIFLFTISAAQLFGVEDYNQRLTPDEFRAKQKTFITEDVGLTTKEANAFFPIYFELQDKKKEINDQIWKLLHKGRNPQTTEEQYNDLLNKMYDLRIASDKLEKAYFQKFKGLLSSRKIYMVQRAEMRFHRKLLRGMNQKSRRKRPNDK